MIAPTLKNGSVSIRPQEADDFEAYLTFRRSPRAKYTALKTDRKNAWFAFIAESGSWSVYGMGAWSIAFDGELAGQVSVMQPPHFPEVEIGWILYDGFEGRGIAYEAASLALDYTWRHIKPETLVSYIDQDNARSIALAERLGAAPDPEARKFDNEDVVYRHRRPS